MNPIKLFVLLALSFSFCACTKKGELGTVNNPLKLYFTPSVNAENISTNSKEFITFLEKETGLFFKTGIATSYIAVVEAFGSARADIGVMNSLGYLLANERYNAQAKLKIIRYGDPHYFGQILAHVDSGINSVKDIHGKKFAFTDPSSTSGYMLALKAFKDQKVTPSQTVFATRHDNVVTMIYQRQVDAGATYHVPSVGGEIKDARALVKTQFPDVAEKVKIIQVTDPIPNEPVVFRDGLSENLSRRVVDAIKNISAHRQDSRS